MRKLIILILVFSCLVFAGCGEKGISHGEVDTNQNSAVKVFEYGSSYITSGLYGYIFSEEKTDYLYISSEYAKYVSGAGFSDTESFWNSPASDGKTFGEMLTENINDYCKELVTVKETASKYNVKVTDKQDIEKAEEIVEELIKSHGSEDDLDSFLYKYGIKTEDLRQYYKDVFLIDALKNYLYGENGSMSIPDEDVKKAFFENYVKFTHIYYKYGEGNETAEEIKTRAKTLFEDIRSGKESFEDHLGDSYDQNATLVLGRGEAYEEFEEAVFGAKTGEYVFSEFESGVYIVRVEELTEDDMSDRYTELESKLVDEAYAEYLKQYYDSVIVNTSELKKYDIATADTFD